jgi:hypothetical protein
MRCIGCDDCAVGSVQRCVPLADLSWGAPVEAHLQGLQVLLDLKLVVGVQRCSPKAGEDGLTLPLGLSDGGDAGPSEVQALGGPAHIIGSVRAASVLRWGGGRRDVSERCHHAMRQTLRHRLSGKFRIITGVLYACASPALALEFALNRGA